MKWLILAFISLFAFPSIAQERIVEFANLPDHELIGGTIADPADWPASPRLNNCSSTIVGPNTMLTAAHCVSNGASKSFTIKGVSYTATCTHHNSYRSNSTADWALCYTSKAIEGITFETIATAKEASCSVGKEFLWTGFGCTRWGAGTDWKLRYGTAPAIRCPSGTNYDTITRGKVALCSGDSGGGGYVVLDDGTRRVVGVNSRSNTTDTSYVSSTYSDSFRNWAKTWGDNKRTKICGIHSDATGCMGEVPPEPVDCADTLLNLALCVDEPKAGCRELYKKFDVCVKDSVE
jgi:hypothetical protein